MTTAPGRADVVYLLLLVQIGAGLLATFGVVLFMANPLYLVVPVGKAAALWVLAAKVVGARRWAVLTVLVLESLSLAGVGLSVLVGLAPVLTRTVTLAGLLTEIALPATVLYLCARLLAERPTPAQPVAPAQPLIPAQPVAPAQPLIPARPVAPAQPAQVPVPRPPAWVRGPVVPAVAGPPAVDPWPTAPTGPVLGYPPWTDQLPDDHPRPVSPGGQR